VVRDRQVMSTVPLRREPQMAAHLPRDLAPERAQGLRQIPAERSRGGFTPR
jgi:hypothetical protein